jgi:hypothetical protein
MKRPTRATIRLNPFASISAMTSIVHACKEQRVRGCIQDEDLAGNQTQSNATSVDETDLMDTAQAANGQRSPK